MQMNALRSANFAKLSSSRSTSDAYCVGSISAGTPGGYCLSQMRSMETPLIDLSPLCLGLASLPAVSSLPERVASRRGLRQRSGSGYWNPRKPGLAASAKRRRMSNSERPQLLLAGLAAGLVAALGLAGFAA